jgi:zinc protease
MKKYLLLLAVTLSTFAASAQSFTKMPMDTAVVYGVLPNGLTYYIRHNEYPKERASFYIAQKVGATLEEDNQNGLAHFLEHMAFNGTKNFPDKGIIDYMEKQGVKFGANINAFTSHDITVYHLSDVPTLRSEVVDSALLVLHDWSGFISLEEKEIDKERGVILEEWRTGNSASRRTYFKHLKNTMPGTRYAERDVIGDTAVINNFKYDELRAYYKKWYRPDLQGIVIVGDIDPRKIEQRIIEMWADIPAPVDPAERVYFPVEDNEKPIVSVVKDDETMYTNITIGLRNDPMSKEMKNSLEGYYMTVVLNLITKGMGTRISDIVEKPDASILAGQCGYGGLTPTKDVFQFVVANKIGQFSEAYSLLIDEVEKLRRYGFTHGEFERAVESMLTVYESSYNARAKRQTSSYCSEYYNSFVNDEPIPGIEFEYDFVKTMLRNLTVENLNSVLPMFLNKNLVIEISARADEQLLTADEMLDIYNASKTKELQAYEDERYDVPLVPNTPKAATITESKVNNELFGVTEWMLSNGVRVLLLPTDYTDNEILFSAVSLGGYSLVQPEDVLTAMSTAGFVDTYGLGEFSNTQLRKVLAGKSVSLSPSIGLYTEALNGSSTKKDFETLMQLAYLSFGRPREDADAYKVRYEYIQTILKNRVQNPDQVFSDSVSVALRPNCAYMPQLTLETMDKLSYEKTLSIYAERFANPADFTFVIVGDFDIDSIKPNVLTYIGGLKTTKAKENYIKRDISIRKGKFENVFSWQMTTPKISNVTVFSGDKESNGTNNMHLNILVELLRKRYLDTIREDEGGSYGVGVGGSINGNHNYTLSIVFDTDEAKFEKLHAIVMREIENIGNNGCNLEDLAKVKENMIKTHTESVKRNGYWRSTIESKVLYKMDFETGYDNLINSVTSDDIKALAKQIITDGNITKVVMKP